MRFTLHDFDLQLAFPWAVAGPRRSPGKTAAPQVFVRLEHEGQVAWGEAAPPERYGESRASVRQFLERVDPARLGIGDLDAVEHYLESLETGHRSAKAAVNTALVDLAARRAGRRLCDYLGLGFTEGRHVTCYSIGLDEPDILRRKIQAADPYPILKLKMGGDHDEETLQIVRLIAPDKWVRIDANEGWKSRELALRRLEWLAGDGRVELVEQPLPAAADPADQVWLKERSPLPLFADESYHDENDIAPARQGFHGVNVKLVKAGGPRAAMRALQAARGAGLQTMIGCMIESSLLISAAAHLAELADYLDLDGSLLITNDPFRGVTADLGRLSFARAASPHGLGVQPANPSFQ
ncbi:MAG TPA: dipeptide epimerase [Candidatus Paceibacterota bacterium]|nr:dipeptide epimerase [Verrucomicrobiota bacterium]HRZ45087.1 dipeptide epimerase [Candidatus Paceibacterota bacterium]HRZ93494.1 dipeptide epimerase [Candidatus Paceibacterota bacterium]